MRTLATIAALLLGAACATPSEHTADEAAPESARSPRASPLTWDGSPEAELTATTTVSAPEYAPPPEDSAPGASYEECMSIWQDASLCSGQSPENDTPPPPDDGIPSIDEQIRQCTEQTGLPQECEDKIRHGIP